MFNGSYTRSASKKILDAVVHIAGILQRRLRCRACGFGWVRRSEEIIARAHYQACVIASAVAELAIGTSTTAVATAHGCDRRTLRRFVERVAAAGDPAEIARELTALVDGPVLPKTPLKERAVPLKCAAQLKQALVLLELIEALGSVQGKEPPALGWFLAESAAARVINGDAQRTTRCRDPPSAP